MDFHWLTGIPTGWPKKKCLEYSFFQKLVETTVVLNDIPGQPTGIVVIQ
jgi:hypothetical protein